MDQGTRQQAPGHSLTLCSGYRRGRYDLGLIGGALLGIRADLDLHGAAAESWIVGAFKLGAFFGTFFGGAAMLRYGRIRAIAANSVFTTLGPVIMAVSSNTG